MGLSLHAMLPHAVAQFMKRAFLLTWTYLWIWQISPHSWAQEAKGILIYRDPSSSSTEVVEYRSVSTTNPLYCTVLQTDGHRRQCKNAGVLGNFEYPPFTFDSSFPALAHSNLEKLQALENQLPGMRGQIEPTRAKWVRALSVSQQLAHPNVAAAEPVSLPLLKIDAVQYSHVRLTAVPPDSVTISYDGGVVKIPQNKLSAAQIVALNRTSQTAQVGTASAAADEKTPAKASEELDSFTAKLKEGGTSVLKFVQGKTGYHAEVIGVWLSFLIFPLLIILLIASSLMQSRKIKMMELETRDR